MKKFWVFRDRKVGKIYAVTAGCYAGRLLIGIEERENEYGFLACPMMENQWISKKDFDFGISNSIIEFVEKAPNEVRQVAKAQFQENEKRV